MPTSSGQESSSEFEKVEQVIFEIQHELERVLEDVDRWADAGAAERLRDMRWKLCEVLNLVQAIG